MKHFFARLASLMKKAPAVRKRFDVSGDIYRQRQDATPAFSYAVKGDFKIDLRHVFLISTAALLFSILHRK